MLEIISTEPAVKAPNIYIVGIGGAGNNAVERMIENGNKNVKFVAINTDMQVLYTCKADTTLQIGKKLTGGNGAGADPLIGEAAAEESKNDIKELLGDADMVILTCGLGGGTGTGAIPVIAKLCKESGILTLAVVTLPFSFEGSSRVMTANTGLEKLKNNVDTLYVVPNDRLLEINDEDIELENAFLFADNILKYTIEGVTNIIFNKGIINIDFNDLKTTLKDKGLGHLGIGIASDSRHLIDAVKDSIESPLLNTTIAGATNILLNTSGRLKMREINEAIQYLKDIVGESCKIIWGTVSGDSKDSDDKSVVTLIATGLKEPALSKTSLSFQAVLPTVSQTAKQHRRVAPSSLDIISLREVPPIKPTCESADFVFPEFLKRSRT